MGASLGQDRAAGNLARLRWNCLTQIARVTYTPRGTSAYGGRRMGQLDISLIFPGGLSVDAAQQLLWPVLIVVLGMTAYAVFVFKFYRFVAARDMFGLDLSRNDAARGAVFWDLIFLIWYVIRYVVLFPAFAFFWFAALTLILVFLSEDRELSSILLIAMATVSAIRATAYYNEELSRDLAKILPFAVLSLFIIDTTSLFNLESSLETLREVNAHLDTIAYYLFFLVALEFGLRLIYVLFRLIFPSRREAEVDHRPSAVPSGQPARQAAQSADVAEFDGQEREQGVNVIQRSD